MQVGSDQTLNSPSTRALGTSHWCQTCDSSQGDTIKIKANIECLCAVLRLSNRPLMDQGRPCSMAYVCVKRRVPNSVNAANNWLLSRTLRGKPSSLWTASNAVFGSADSGFKDHRGWDHLFLTNRWLKGGSPARSQIHDSVSFAHWLVSRLVEFQITSEVIKNPVHLQSSFQERSQGDLWSGGNGSRLVCCGQSRSDGTLRSRVQSPLKWWVHQPEELNSIPLSIHGQRRHQGRRQLCRRVLKDWRSAVPFTGVTPKQTGYTCNQRCPQTNPSWWSHSNSGRDETSNLGHSGSEECVSLHQKVCHVLPLQLRANTAAHGWPAIQSHWGSRTCFLLCRPRIRRTSNIQKCNWMCQGLRSCVYMVSFKGSSSRSSIIIDVRCHDGSSKTIHCETSSV